MPVSLARVERFPVDAFLLWLCGMSPENKAIQTEGSPGVGGMEARFSVSRRAAGEEAGLGGLCVSDWEVVPGRVSRRR